MVFLDSSYFFLCLSGISIDIWISRLQSSYIHACPFLLCIIIMLVMYAALVALIKHGEWQSLFLILEYANLFVQSSAIQPSDNQLCLTDFESIKVIGKGNSGIVWLVQHKWTQQLFALKVFYTFICIVNCKNYSESSKEKAMMNCARKNKEMVWHAWDSVI